jgi:hypothetical protein
MQTGSIALPRVISEAFRRFRQEGSLGGAVSIDASDLSVLGRAQESSKLRQFDNQPGLDEDPRAGHLQLSFEAKNQLGMAHWESYRAQLKPTEILVHAASGESTQEYNLLIESATTPAVLRAGVDLNEVFLDAYRFGVNPEGQLRSEGREFQFLSDRYGS